MGNILRWPDIAVFIDVARGSAQELKMHSVKSIFRYVVVVALPLLMLSGCIVVEPDHHYRGDYGHRYSNYDDRYVEPRYRDGDRDDNRCSHHCD